MASVPVPLFAGKKVVVFGLARSGLATVSWLVNQGAKVIGIDADLEKQNQARQLGAQIALPESLCWEDIVAVVQSPGIPLTHPVTQAAVQKNIPLLSDCDLFRKANPHAKVVGVTGTNGKSTTTALLGHILNLAGYRTAIGGNIGIPVLSLPPLGDNGIYIFELSSYQLDLSDTLNIDNVAWLNISEDHLERHGSMDQYVQAKCKIFHSLKRPPQLVIGIDDSYSQTVYDKYRSPDCKAIPVSCKSPPLEGLWVKDHKLYNIENGREFFITELNHYPQLQGIHNYQNIAVAYGICCQLGVDSAKILAGIASFPGLEHRQEWVTKIHHVAFINDSKATNADAAAKALSVYDHIYWIAGGVPKSDGIRHLKAYFPKVCEAFLFGQAADEFAITLGDEVPHQVCHTLDVAVKCAFEAAQRSSQKNSVVLFSPACASFDQFQDFEHRGLTFKKLVYQLKECTC